MDILIAEDMQISRDLLQKQLRHFGHNAIAVSDGEEAFAALQNSTVNFLITDWTMPKLSGIELCRKIRAANFNRYIYIIILSARSSQEELIEGLNAGADDFLKKPFHPLELQVRVQAGARVLELEKQLARQNNALAEANEKIGTAYARIQSDIDFAASIQRNLIPARRQTIYGYRFDWLFMPSQGISGDVFNFFPIDDKHIAFYQIDVAGHGIASAMLAYTLNKFLTPFAQKDGLFFCNVVNKEEILEHPSKVLEKLNEFFLNEVDCLQYFTICFGIIHSHENLITLSRAGHPLPILVKGDTGEQIIQIKGFPVGMFGSAAYNNERFTMRQGDKLFLYTDGAIDVANHRDEMFGSERLMDILRQYRKRSAKEIFKRIQETIAEWNNSELFNDDISVLCIERKEKE